MSIYYYQLTGSQEEVLERLRLHNVGDMLWYDFDEETLKIWFGDKYRCKKETQFQIEFVDLNEKTYLMLEALTLVKGVSGRVSVMDSFWKMKVGAIPQKTNPLVKVQNVTYTYVEGVPRKKNITKTTIKVIALLLLIVRIIIPITYSTKYDCMQKSENVKTIRIYEIKNGILSWEEEKTKSYKTIEQLKYDEFIGDLEEIPFKNTIWLLPIPTDPNYYYYGSVVELIYEDESYEVIPMDGPQMKMDSEGEWEYKHYWCDEKIWGHFLEQYK